MSNIRTVALFKSIDYGWDSVFEKKECLPGGYIQISEDVEVDFTALADESIIAAAAQSIEKQIEDIKEDSIKRIEKLKIKKAELLALTQRHNHVTG